MCQNGQRCGQGVSPRDERESIAAVVWNSAPSGSTCTHQGNKHAERARGGDAIQKHGVPQGRDDTRPGQAGRSDVQGRFRSTLGAVRQVALPPVAGAPRRAAAGAAAGPVERCQGGKDQARARPREAKDGQGRATIVGRVSHRHRDHAQGRDGPEDKDGGTKGDQQRREAKGLVQGRAHRERKRHRAH